MNLHFHADAVRDGLGSLHRRLVAVSGYSDHAGPLMERWERIIEEDNRTGILAGLDKDGNPAPPLKYRPFQPKPVTKAQRLNQPLNKTRGKFLGIGVHTTTEVNNNLTTSQYRKLAGPRLAPRGQFSRVITNLLTGHGRDPANLRVWFAEAAWLEVVDRERQPFLQYHFDGTGRLPRYDLRGIRPAGVAKMVESLREWAKLTIRELYDAG